MALIFWLLNLNGISKHTHTHFMAHFIRQTTLSSSMVFGSRDLVLLQQMPLQCSLVQQQQFSCRGGDALATVKYLLTNHEDCRNRTATGTTLQKDAEELCSRMPLWLKRDFFTSVVKHYVHVCNLEYGIYGEKVRPQRRGTVQDVECCDAE